MATTFDSRYGFPDHLETGRIFGYGDGSRVLFNLAGMDAEKALIHPILYKIDWGGIQQLYSTARTNYALQSQTFQTSWTTNNTTITANVGSAPDGTATADKIVEAATTSTHTVYQQKTSTTGLVLSHSVYAKAAERTFFFMTEGNSVTASAIFNLTTGVVVSTSGTGSPSAAITGVGDGWYRCTLTFTAGANANIQFGPALNSTTSSYLGDITKGVWVWGGQQEISSSATAYIPTTTAAVTVTDYSTDSAGKVTFASAPAAGTQITYKDQYSSNGYRHFGLGDGTNVDFSLPFAPATPLIYRRSWAGNELLYATARTNVLLQSQAFNTSWTKVNCTVSSDSTIAPDGTLTADTIVASSTDLTRFYQQVNGAVTTTATVVFQLYVRAGTVSTMAVGIGDEATFVGTSQSGVIAEGPGSISQISGCSYSVTGLSASEWTKIVLTRTGFTSTLFYAHTYPNSITSANNGDTLVYWGADAKVGSATPTPYIPTTVAAVTVTDYTVAPNGDVTFVSAPADGVVLSATMSMGPLR